MFFSRWVPQPEVLLFDNRIVLGSVCEEEVDGLLAEADVNKDDKIDIDEFVTVMNKK